MHLRHAPRAAVSAEKGVATAQLRPVSRLSLIEHWGIEPDARLSLLQAPAGYGKTMLLAQWQSALQARGRRAAVLALPPEVDLAALLRALRAALRALGVAVPAAADAHGGLPQLINGLASCERPLYLLVDDLDHLRDADALLAFDLLLRHAPPGLRLIASARQRPTLPLGRLAITGQLTRLPAQALLFSLAQTRAAWPHGGDAAALASTHAACGGWPALLRQAAMPEGDAEAYFTALLRDWPQALQAFVRASAVAESFDADTIGALLPGCDAAAQFEAASQAGVPLIEAAPGRFGYPPRLRHWLCTQLAASERRQLRRRCIDALSTGPQWPQALRLGLDPDGPDGAELTALDAQATTLLWLAGPERIVAAPAIAGTALPSWQRVRRLAAELLDGDGLPPLESVLDEAATVHPPLTALAVALRHAATAEALETAREALRQLPDELPFAIHLAQMLTAFALRDAGDAAAALAQYAEALAFAARAGLGEQALRRAGAGADQLRGWLGAPLSPSAMGDDGWSPGFVVAADARMQAAQQHGGDAAASAVAAAATACARRRGWAEAALELDCLRGGDPTGLAARSPQLAAPGTPLRQKLALATVRRHLLDGEISSARETLAAAFLDDGEAHGPLHLTASFLRLGLALVDGDAVAPAQIDVLLAQAAPCPCIGLLQADGSRLLHWMASDARRRILQTLLDRLAAQARRLLDGVDAPPVPAAAPSLSPRERDVLDLLLRGMSRREAADLLQISEASVRSHQLALFAKLGAQRRSDAVQQARRRGF